MATSWISFGPDLEPIESELRRGAGTPARRIDGIRVAGSAEEVAAALSDGWCRFEQVLDDGERRPVYLNGAAARLVTEESAD
jgi:hypothetical protein